MSKDLKHTPGPWVAICSIPQEGCDGWWIKAQPHAALRGFTHDLAWVNGGEENAANARLIAAAPDLLAALHEAERFLDYFANGRASFVGSGTPASALKMVRAAFAKATESPSTERDGGEAKRSTPENKT